MPKVFRNPEVMWREEDEAKAQAMDALERGDDVEEVGTSLLFADGMMLTLNMLGTEIWKLCDGRDTSDMLNSLLEQFDVEEDVLLVDDVAVEEALEEVVELELEVVVVVTVLVVDDVVVVVLADWLDDVLIVEVEADVVEAVVEVEVELPAPLRTQTD